MLGKGGATMGLGGLLLAVLGETRCSLQQSLHSCPLSCFRGPLTYFPQCSKDLSSTSYSPYFLFRNIIIIITFLFPFPLLVMWYPGFLVQREGLPDGGGKTALHVFLCVVRGLLSDQISCRCVTCSPCKAAWRS